MYYSKVGPSPRTPTGEWVGCGFSKTHLSLFPTTSSEKKDGTDEPNDDDRSVHSKDHDDKIKTNNNNCLDPEDKDDNYTATTPVNNSRIMTSNGKLLLTPQHSNLLEFASPRSKQRFSAQPTDLGSIFLEQGLEKYIGMEENLRSCNLSKLQACFYVQ